MKDIDIEENNSCRYEIRYNRIYDYITTHTTLKNTILFIYKVLPYFVALSYILLIIMCLRRKDSIVTPAISFSVDATGYVETSNIFVISKLILTPLTSFIVVSFFRKCIDAKDLMLNIISHLLLRKIKKVNLCPAGMYFQ